MTRSIEVDVVAVGAGFGGLVCGLTAHDAGLSALVVEKSSKVGGVTAMSAGQVWVPGNHVARSLGIEDSWQSGSRYIERIGAGTADRTRLESLLSHAVEVLEYIEDRTSLTWNLIPLADYYAGTAHDGLDIGRYVEPTPLPAAGLGIWQSQSRRGTLFPDAMTSEESVRLRKYGEALDPGVRRARFEQDIRCGGSAIAIGLIKAVLDRQVPIMAGFTVTTLIRDDSTDRIIGLDGIVDGAPVRILARKGILLATGGYDRHAGMVRRHDGLDRYGSVAPATNTGSSLLLAGRHGAQMAYNEKPFQLGFHVPGERDDEGADVWRVVSMQPHSILVNRRGRRFADESHYLSYSAAMRVVDGRVQERPNLPVFFICDSRYLETVGIGGLGRADAPADLLVESPDLVRLGNELGIDGEVLSGTVARFNESAARGYDEDFRRGETLFERRSLPADSTAADALGSIADPPFFGVQLDPVGMGFANLGLVGDTNGRVLDWEDRPIEGLYAAGNSLAMMEIGSGYQSGFANMRGMTYGYLAARHMAGVDAPAS